MAMMEARRVFRGFGVFMGRLKGTKWGDAEIETSHPFVRWNVDQVEICHKVDDISPFIGVLCAATPMDAS